MLKNICEKKPKFPNFISREGVDFISKLLQKDSIERTEFVLKTGIKNHEWFAGVGN